MVQKQIMRSLGESEKPMSKLAVRVDGEGKVTLEIWFTGQGHGAY